MKKLVLILLLFNFIAAKAQVTGSVFLSGQSNHSGIKVKFKANSGTAVTDSTYTNASGAFSKNINAGVYYVTYSYSGYQTYFSNNNTPIVLSNTTSLGSVTLSPGNLVYISGNASGTWSNNTVYMVQGDIIVPLGSTLTVQPGTQIKFTGSYSLNVKGVLNATGTSSNKIVFTSGQQNPVNNNWLGIFIENSNSTVKNCLVEYAVQCINVNGGFVTIEDNEVRNFDVIGIYNLNSSSLINGNSVHGYNMHYYGHGITNEGTGSPTIECNTVFDGSGFGIRVWNNTLVKNNLIYSISSMGGQYGWGIYCDYYITGRMENNVIHGCSRGIFVGENSNPVPSPLIINNTLYGNSVGIEFGGQHASGSVIGNIVVNNTVGISQPGGIAATTPSVISHNLVWNNSTANYDNIQIVGLGQNVSTNSNGNPIDSYFNLSMDPLFNAIPHYSSSSPCINAGDPAYSNNIGCNVSAMCAEMVLGITTHEPIPKYKLFPNPFSSVMTLTGLNSDELSGAKLYDLNGKAFEAVVENFPGTRVNIRTHGLAPGIYFLEVTFQNSSKDYIRVIKE